MNASNYYTKSVYELRETLFLKLDAFNIPYRDELKLSRNLVKIDIESICNEEDSYKEMETTKGIRRHVPISVSVSPSLIREPIFFCNTDPHHLVSSFIITLEGLATHSKVEMKFIEAETAIKIKLCKILEQLNQRHNLAETGNSDGLCK